MYDNVVMSDEIIDTESDSDVLSALRELGRISKALGNDKMTIEEIDAEIAAFRAGH